MMGRPLLWCCVVGWVLIAASAAAEPLRVATLVPYAESALRDMPESVTIVANVRARLSQPVADGEYDLGSPHSPNFEALASSNAQLVVGDGALHVALGSKVEELGMQFLLIDSSSVASTLAGLRELGERVGARQAMMEATEAVERDLDTLKLSSPVGALVLFGRPGSFYVVSERAWLGDLIARLGFTNLAPAGQSERMPGFLPVNDEALAMIEPDLVVLVAHGDPRTIERELRAKMQPGAPWASLGRASKGIHVLSPDLFNANPGLNLPAAAKLLAALASEASVSAQSRDARE